MAKMIPSEIGYYALKSGENEMFASLSKLPDDYYVFHSYRVVSMIGNDVNESEADFVIFNPKYGCLVIEAKNGHVYRDENGDWHYSDGTRMKDPFDQACSSMYAIINKLKENSKYRSMISRCKFLFSVWFPAYTSKQIEEADFGPNINKNLILSKDTLIDPTPSVEFIMQEIQKLHVVYKQPEIIEDASNYKHGLTKEESLELFKNVLCPSFDIVPNRRKEFEEETYSKLLDEQYIILDFLSAQKSAAIAGASGTGKTFVALERARRLSGYGNKILFLCYNNNLKKHLEENYKMPDVEFYTIDGFACKICKTSEANYYQLKEAIENQIILGQFEYKHILVDEGQDFGIPDIESSGVLDLLADYGTNSEDASFFIFYDKNQLVNGSKQLPTYLQNVDSKLTLYKNCRNTKKIADTAYSLIDVKPQTYNGALKGDDPKFVFYSSLEELRKRVDNVISNLSKDSQYDKVILSCKGLENESLHDFVDQKGNYKTDDGKKVRLYSVSTFKGLEADNVILIDVDKNCFDEGNVTFYVGASRAKKNLYVFVNVSDEELSNILETRFPKSFKKKDKKQQMVLAMHGVLNS